MLARTNSCDPRSAAASDLYLLLLRPALLALTLLPTLAHAQAYDDPETERVLCKLDGSCPKTPEPAAPPTSPGSDSPVEPPPVVRKRPTGLALARNAYVITLTTEASLGRGAIGKPTSIAPDVSYGLTDRVTLSLVHSGFATTGFRGSAGGGLCVTGEGCAHVYNNAGVEALVDVVRGPFSLAAVGGVYALSFDPLLVDVKLGVQASARLGAVTATLSPSVFVGVTKRAQNEGVVFVPASVGRQLTRSWFAAVGGGVATPLDDAGGSWTARVGVIARYRIDRGLFVAGSLFLPKLAGGDAVLDTGLDAKVANLWITYSR